MIVVNLYQHVLTCTMIQALEEHGLIKGSFLGTKRLLRCNPFTNEKYTYDPVPKKKNKL